ncbi:ABC transporter permease [uncultured Amnibacterium sp.]|uniref:ABC transporter permease n=1 Tax=uncultured Amnibacterium sp. TaxID=1631851 RepID=UPI0035CA2E43
MIDFSWIAVSAPAIVGLLVAHLVLSVVPVLIGLALAIPVGWFAYGVPVLRTLILGVSGVLYTVPSLALFVLLPRIIGTRILDPMNVVVALAVYAFALLVRTVVDGLGSVSPEARQAAEAMGYRRLGRFLTIELPIATPVVLAGLRVATASAVSIVSVASLIGIDQLGSLFTQGMQLQFVTPIVVGIVLCLLLAVCLDGLILLADRLLTPWRRRSGATA